MNSCTAALACVVALLFAHFRWAPAELPMLQIATLRHDSITFFRRDVQKAAAQVQVRRLAADVRHNDLFDERVWREQFQRSTDRSTIPSRLTPNRCYAYHSGSGALYGAFCTPPEPTAASSHFRGLFGSCMAVTLPPRSKLFRRRHEIDLDVPPPLCTLMCH